jgi:hypothetical protein
MNFSTLMTYGWVVRQVPTSLRNDILTFDHHRHVAALPPAEQRHWLDHRARERPTRMVGSRRGRQTASRPRSRERQRWSASRIVGLEEMIAASLLFWTLLGASEPGDEIPPLHV